MEGDPLTRNANDAAALDQKRAAKAAKLEEVAEKERQEALVATQRAAMGGGRKKKAKEAEGLDDLLTAGLAGAKKVREAPMTFGSEASAVAQQ